MKPIAGLALLAGLVSLAAPAEEPALVAVRAARLLDVRSGRMIENPIVVIRGDRIESVAKSVPAGAKVLDLGTRTLLPGLIDAHTHVLLQGDATEPEYNYQILQEYPAHRVVRAVRALQIALEHGFTGLRDLETEGAGYDDVALRDAVNEGVVPGPRMQVVGPALSTTGSYPITHFRPDWKFPTGVQICDGADGCRKAVREQLSYGTNWVKIYANTGGLRLTPDGYVDSPPNWTKEEIEAVVSEAHAHGVKVAAHARSDTRRAARGRGRRGLDRARGLDPTRDGRRDGAQGNLPLPDAGRRAPTSRLCGRRPAARSARSRRRSRRSPSPTAARPASGSSSAPTPEGSPGRRSTRRRSSSGKSSSACRRSRRSSSATTVAAELLGWQGKAGVVEAGAWADLVAVEGDPLDRHLRASRASTG